MQVNTASTPSHTWAVRSSATTCRILSAALVLLATATGTLQPGWAQQSALLESVKQNPQRGKTLCQQLRQLNAQGQSFTSSQVTAAVARQQSLTSADAEVLVTYVVGFYCPDVY